MKNRQEKDLHILFKKIGETPLECIERFKLESKEFESVPMTYAGRLDPLAEGLLLVLSGEKLKEKDKFTNLPKAYEFEVLWGFETDTHDLLGKVIKAQDFFVEEKEVKEKIRAFVGKSSQIYPAFSSKPVLGKPLFLWAREGKLGEIEIPSHDVEIYHIEFISRREISGDELIEQIESKISSVKGDFRQVEILSKWKEILNKEKEKIFMIDKFAAKVSSGFYVRQFVADLAVLMKGVATAYHIKRTEVGEYKVDK